MRRKAITGLVALGVCVGLASASVSAATVVVTEASIGSGWTTADTRANGSNAFVTTWGAPAGLGNGALQQATGETAGGLDKAQFFYEGLAGSPLAQLEAISYWTYRDAASSGATSDPQVRIALNVEIVGDLGGGQTFTTLVFEPYLGINDASQSLVDNTWQQWDAAAGEWWSTRATGSQPTRSTLLTWDEVQAAYPGAVLGRAGFNLGSFNPLQVQAADGLTFNTTTFDFQPRVFDKADCKGGGWETNFPAGQFKNQGDCVSYFASSGRTHGE